MHRNTYLLVSILAIIAALLTGVNLGKRLNKPPSETPTPAVTTTPTPITATKTYLNDYCGFSLSYPDTYTILEDASGSAILQYSKDTATFITMTCQNDIPRSPLPPDKIETLSIPTSTGASVSAKLYHDANNRDGSPIDAVIFTHPKNKMDVFIAGYGDAYNAAIKTIQITP